VLSLIVPVYRNEGSLPDLLNVLDGLHDSLRGEFEAVLVVDGSPDRSYDVLSGDLPKRRFQSQLLLLSRNFGSFQAIRVGLAAGTGKYFAVMAADLQEPPEVVLEMNQVLRDEAVDVVVGGRLGREDPLSQRIPSHIFWSLYRRYVVPEMPPGGVDVFGCNRVFRDHLLNLGESHSSLVAQIFWLGFRRKTIGYERRARQHGTSGWTFRKKVNYLLDSVFAFTDLPIRLLTRLGAVGVVIGTTVGIAALISKLAGWIDVPGYAMTIIVIAIFGAFNMLSLGIIGSYAWRTYENTKARPLAIPMRAMKFGLEDKLG
jgi:glycosyltransferase involved in cell wall biosynthesis